MEETPMSDGFYELAAGQLIDLADVIEIGAPIVAQEWGDVRGSFSIRHRSRGEPVRYSWAANVPENMRKGMPGWWDMPYLEAGEMPMEKWGPIVRSRIEETRKRLFEAWREFRGGSTAEGSDAMTVGEYAAWLLATFDPSLPVHKDVGAGELAPVTWQGVRQNVIARSVMKARNEDFYALASADIWKNARAEFGPDFDAVVMM